MDQRRSGRVSRTLGRGGVLAATTVWLVLCGSSPGHADEGVLPGDLAGLGDATVGEVVAPVLATADPAVPPLVDQLAEGTAQPVQEVVEPVAPPVVEPVQQAVAQVAPPAQTDAQQVAPSAVKGVEPPIRQLPQPTAEPAEPAPEPGSVPAAPPVATPADPDIAATPAGPDGGGGGVAAAAPAGTARDDGSPAAGRAAERRPKPADRRALSPDLPPRGVGGPIHLREVDLPDSGPGPDKPADDLFALTSALMRVYAGPTGIAAGLPGPFRVASAGGAWLPLLLLGLVSAAGSAVLARRRAAPYRLTGGAGVAGSVDGPLHTT